MTQRGHPAFVAIAVVAVLLSSCPPGEAQGGGGKEARRPKTAAELATDVVRALNDYRAALARALPAQEATAQEALETLQERQDLHAAEVLPVELVEDARRRWETAQRDLDDTRTALEEVDRMILEASVQEQLARLRPLGPGGYEATKTLVRFNGVTRWSLSDVPKLAAAFERFFGQRLPISAFGQTNLHRRMGLDHRDAIDVAVHPDSAEGQWLMKHLRTDGVPFIAVREPIPGSSTGAHIHVGPASARTVAR